jgi:hypothetical protein
MKQKIDKSDFDFDGFFDAIVVFIEENFGTTPNAAETMRYFYSFTQETDITNSTFPAKDPFEIMDFKNAVLQGGETIFLPFTSGLLMDGSVNLASDGNVQLSKTESPRIGMTDCWGILTKLEKGNFIFQGVIGWGGMTSSIEEASHPKIDKVMNEFLNSFNNK